MESEGGGLASWGPLGLGLSPPVGGGNSGEDCPACLWCGHGHAAHGASSVACLWFCPHQALLLLCPLLTSKADCWLFPEPGGPFRPLLEDTPSFIPVVSFSLIIKVIYAF